MLGSKREYEKIVEKMTTYKDKYDEYKLNKQTMPADFIEDYQNFYFASNNLTKIINRLKNELTLQPPIKDQPSLKKAIEESCKPKNTLAILIQHLKNVTTLHDFMHSLPNDTLNPDDLYEQSEILFLFYQIYFPLAQLKTLFTHNDLHTSNVLLYQPDDDVKYIEYHYHISKDVVVRFKSRFMVKIIDYGRAFYYDNDILNSSKVYDEVCDSKICTPGQPSFRVGNPNDQVCGRDTGFKYYLSYGKDNVSAKYRTSRYSNMSSDLRLLNIFTHDDYLKKFSPTMADLTDLFDRVEYSYKTGAKEMTPERKIAANIPPTSNKIYNVVDAEKELRILALDDKYIKLNEDMYYDYEQLGELHIYSDGREMKYIESSNSEA